MSKVLAFVRSWHPETTRPADLAVPLTSLCTGFALALYTRTNAAIANAVFHATGKRIRDLPIRLDKLLPESRA